MINIFLLNNSSYFAYKYHVIWERCLSCTLRFPLTEQRGFMYIIETREQIVNTRQRIEKSQEFHVKTHLCFVDYRRAIAWSGKPIIGFGKYRSSKTFGPRSGVRQSYIVSPILFNEYVLAYSGEELVQIMSKLDRSNKDYDFMLNKKKTQS